MSIRVDNTDRPQIQFGDRYMAMKCVRNNAAAVVDMLRQTQVQDLAELERQREVTYAEFRKATQEIRDKVFTVFSNPR